MVETTAPLAAIPTLAHIEGQHLVQAALSHAIKIQRLPASMLFVGQPHVGKRTTAFSLALTLNCLQPKNLHTFCGECSACQKILAGVHPDFSLVAPQGRLIKIEQLREVIEHFHRPAYEAKKRVIVLHQAETMSTQTANAFLKTLEEPPQDSLLIVCTSTPRLLPSTIVSRCATLHFSPLTQAFIEQHLKTHFAHQSAEVLGFAAQFSLGSLRFDLVEQAPVLMPLRKAWVEWLKHPKAAQLTQCLNACSQAVTTNAWAFVLDWLETWLRDASYLVTASPQERLVPNEQAAFNPAAHTLINHDYLDELTQFAKRYHPDALAQLWREVLAARCEINDWNVNKALRLQTLLLEFRQKAQHEPRHV